MTQEMNDSRSDAGCSGCCWSRTAAIAAAATYGAYRTALAPFEAAYDKALLDAALAIASNIEARGADGPALSLTPDAVNMLRSDSLDTIYYRVSGEDGHFIAGDRDLPVPHQGIENPEFDDLPFGGESIRLLQLPRSQCAPRVHHQRRGDPA